MTILTMLADSRNYGGARAAGDIRYLVLHYTANDGDTAAANAQYFASGKRGASAHYFVDDDGAVQSVPDLRAAYSVGGSKYSDCAATGGGTLYGVCTNKNSLNVELCDTVKNGTIAPTEATLQNAAALCRQLMEQYAIPIERVIRHFDVNGKHCPAYLMEDAAWADFKSRLIGDLTGAIVRLARKGVIASPDYWLIHGDDLPYLPRLIVAAERAVIQKGTPAATMQAALDKLSAAGVIASPEYWAQNAGKVRFLPELVMALGGSVA